MQTKPEPIRISAQGIESKPITMNQPEPVVDWDFIASLPPFQMFVQERSPCPEDANTEQWAREYSRRFVAEIGSLPLLEIYVEWHSAKGYWPNESPVGEDISGRMQA